MDTLDTLENRLRKRINVSLYALIFLTTLLGLSVLLESCSDTCEVTRRYAYYEPVYTTFDEIRASVKLLPPQPIQQVGKIYFKDDILFINEPGKGIHIIDDHDPAHPAIKSFLAIPGTYDLAIQGETLYADSYIDLVALDISNLSDIKEVARLENLFSNYNSLGFYAVADKGLVTDWVLRPEVSVVQSECDAQLEAWGGIYYEGGIAVTSDASFNKSAAIAPGNGSGPGVGGSMARFTLSKNHLYALDVGNLQPVNVTNEKAPVALEKMYVGWDIETIFPYADNLFIGASGGMRIMDISSPGSPTLVSTYEHVRSCDPVVVDGTHAYVTLRSGTECLGYTNQLEVIDLENLQAPALLKVYPMHNPHGLGKDNSTLFICDGDEGLKVYDASDINTIDQKLLAHYDDIHAYDVIPFNNVLMMIGADGLFQYDYSDPTDIKLLSHIVVSHEEE